MIRLVARGKHRKTLPPPIPEGRLPKCTCLVDALISEYGGGHLPTCERAVVFLMLQEQNWRKHIVKHGWRTAA